MSGFVGIVSFDGQPIDLAGFERMMERIEYRGFDGAGRFVTDNIALGHRLFKSTFESEHEQQPFTVGHLTIVADAILYNRDDLITELKRQRRDITSDAPDVELILASYQVWGRDCVQHLIGIYTFAICDTNLNHVFLVRDHFGAKPVYYVLRDGLMLFSTELIAILRYDAQFSQIDPVAIGDYLMFGGVSKLDKSQTIFASIRRLKPAHMLYKTRDEETFQKYWSFPVDVPLLKYKDENSYLDHYREVLTTSLRGAMRGPEIVISLSGGMDSSTLAAITSNQPDIPTQLRFFTAVYEHIHPDVEGYYAQVVAKHFGQNTNLFVADPYQLDKKLAFYAEPTQWHNGDLSEGQLRFLRGLGRLVMHGEGNDEVLRFSTIYDAFLRMAPVQFMKYYLWLWRFQGHRPPLTGVLQAVQRRLKGALGLPQNYAYPTWLDPDFEKSCELKERWAAFWNRSNEPEHPMHSQVSRALVYPDWQHTSERYEARNFTPPDVLLPFLNLNIINFILSVPIQPFFQNKHILRKTMSDVLPEIIIRRPKSPAGAVLQSWANQPGAAWIKNWKPSNMITEYVNDEHLYPILPDNAALLMGKMQVIELDYWLRHVVS